MESARVYKIVRMDTPLPESPLEVTLRGLAQVSPKATVTLDSVGDQSGIGKTVTAGDCFNSVYRVAHQVVQNLPLTLM